MQVIVRNFNLETNEEISILTIDILDPEQQEWLMQKHLIWAFNNHVGVQMLNRSDEPELSEETIDEAKQRQYVMKRREHIRKYDVKESLGRGKKRVDKSF